MGGYLGTGNSWGTLIGLCSNALEGAKILCSTAFDGVVTGVGHLHSRYSDYKHNQQETANCQQREATRIKEPQENAARESNAATSIQQAATDHANNNDAARATAAANANKANLKYELRNLKNIMSTLDPVFIKDDEDAVGKSTSSRISRLARHITTTLTPCKSTSLKLDTSDKTMKLYEGVRSLKNALDNHISTLSIQSQANGTYDSRDPSSRNQELLDLQNTQTELAKAKRMLHTKIQEALATNHTSDATPGSTAEQLGGREDGNKHASRYSEPTPACTAFPPGWQIGFPQHSQDSQGGRMHPTSFNPTPVGSRLQSTQRTASWHTRPASGRLQSTQRTASWNTRPASGRSQHLQEAVSSNMSHASGLWTECSNYLNGNDYLEGSIMISKEYKLYAKDKGWTLPSHGVHGTPFDYRDCVKEFAKGVCGGTIRLKDLTIRTTRHPLF